MAAQKRAELGDVLMANEARGKKRRLGIAEEALRIKKERLEDAEQEYEEEHQTFTVFSKRLEEKIVTAQVMQARLADNAVLMFAWSCVLSKLDQQLAQGADGPKWERDKLAGLHFMHLAHERIEANVLHPGVGGAWERLDLQRLVPLEICLLIILLTDSCCTCRLCIHPCLLLEHLSFRYP